MKKILIFVFVVVVMLVFIIFSRNKECMETTNKTCLLLACCVNARNEKEKRIKWYTDAINKYLETTNLQIRVIESSGYDFSIEHERFKQHSFVTSIDRENIEPTSIIQTRREAESILKAYESGILDGFDIVVKITGKYYVPELEQEISKIPNDCGIIYQQSKLSETSQSSEIFGFKKEYTDYIFGSMLNGDLHFEEAISNIHEKLNCNSYRIPKKMKVECIDECPYKSDKNTFLKEL